MDGIVLVVPQASTDKQVFAFPPKDLGDSFQAIFVGVNPDDTTRGLVATVTKELYELQVALLRKHLLHGSKHISLRILQSASSNSL